MKKSRFTLLALCLSLFLSCGGDDAIVDGGGNATDVAVTGNPSKVGASYAYIDGYVNLNLVAANYTSQELGVEFSMFENFTKSGHAKRKELTGNKLTVYVDTLTANTKYYYRTYVKLNEIAYYGETRSFSTKDFINVTSTGDAINPTSNSVTLLGNVDIQSVDKEENFSIGMVYSTSSTNLHPESSNNNIVRECPLSDVEDGEYSVSLSNLKSATTYYYCSYMNMGKKYKIGQTKSFVTNEDGSPVDPDVEVGEGWPAAYDGVMLQGFYWDGFGDAKWTRLESQADDFAPYFSLIWIPQSGNCGGTSMGYDDLYWFDNYDSSFGTKNELRSMIATFKSKGIGTIADVVINHRKNVSNWVDFPKETYKGVTYEMVSTDICADDDDGKTKQWATQNGYQLSSNRDTGEGWGGMRDLDHTSTNVQTIVKAYLDFLLNDLGYIGFRYDMVKGYAPSYTKVYNASAKPKFSVGECWDGTNTIKSWIDATGKSSAAFDFQFRYVVRNAVNNQNWARLAQQNEGNWPLVYADYNAGTYRQYAVTFVENHDTEYRSASAQQDPIRRDTLAANAYMLAMPGTPCVFLKHWKTYKHDIARMIQARQVAGIQNTSTYTKFRSNAAYYAAKVEGAKGQLVVWLGDQSKAAAEIGSGFTKILEGHHYSYWIENSLVAAWQAMPAPTFKEDTVKKHDITIHLKDPGWPQVYFYAWDGNLFINDEWPGVKVTATKNIGGVKYYYRTFNVSAETGYSMNVIFDQGSSDAQSVDITGITSDRYYEIASSTNKFEVRDITSEVTGQ